MHVQWFPGCLSPPAREPGYEATPLSKPSSKEELAKFDIKELEELEGGKCSGSGSFGTVFKVIVDGVTRIAKRLHNVLIAPDIRPEDKDGIRERFYECLLLSKLDHPCIV